MGKHPNSEFQGKHGKRVTVKLDGPNAKHRNTADPRIEVQSVPSDDLGPGREDGKSRVVAGERGSGR